MSDDPSEAELVVWIPFDEKERRVAFPSNLTLDPSEVETVIKEMHDNTDHSEWDKVEYGIFDGKHVIQVKTTKTRWTFGN